VIELAEDAAEFGLLGMVPMDAGGRQPVQGAELLLPEALVEDEFGQDGQNAPAHADPLGRAHRAQ